MATFGTFAAGQVLTAAELNAAGTWTDYTPTFTQSATITKTTNWARYMQFNKLVTVSFKITASGAGTANNKILCGLPVSASTNNYAMGFGTYFSPTGTYLPLVAYFESATTIQFLAGTNSLSAASILYFGQTGFLHSGSTQNITIASGASMFATLTYEAA